MMNFQEVRQAAQQVNFHAERIASHAGDKRSGARFAQPNEAWTKGEVTNVVLHALKLAETAGMSVPELLDTWSMIAEPTETFTGSPA